MPAETLTPSPLYVIVHIARCTFEVCRSERLALPEALDYIETFAGDLGPGEYLELRREA